MFSRKLYKVISKRYFVYENVDMSLLFLQHCSRKKKIIFSGIFQNYLLIENKFEILLCLLEWKGKSIV